MGVASSRVCAAVLAALVAGGAYAAERDLPAAARQLLERETADLPGRVEISALSPVSPPCRKVEAFVPSGARLWGQSAVGLRCADGSNWSTYLPVRIRVFAPAVVAARTLAAGQSIGESDVRVQEIDLTREPAGVIVSTAQATSKVLARPLAPGQVLRQDFLRSRPVVSAGDVVRVEYAGQGFMVSAEARALNEAPEGQQVRVQTTSGRILTGTARSGRRVEMRP